MAETAPTKQALSVAEAKNVSDFAAIFNDVEEVLYNPNEFKASGATAIEGLYDLPVLGDSITFNMGEVELTQIKLTNETIWSSKATRGDSDISFNVASVSEEINSLFMNDKSLVAQISGAFANGEKGLEGKGYNLQPKALTGSLIFPSQDRSVVVILPNIKAYASLNIADGDNPAYFSVKVTPQPNSEGAEIFIFTKKLS